MSLRVMNQLYLQFFMQKIYIIVTLLVACFISTPRCGSPFSSCSIAAKKSIVDVEKCLGLDNVLAALGFCLHFAFASERGLSPKKGHFSSIFCVWAMLDVGRLIPRAGSVGSIAVGSPQQTASERHMQLSHFSTWVEPTGLNRSASSQFAFPRRTEITHVRLLLTYCAACIHITCTRMIKN